MKTRLVMANRQVTKNTAFDLNIKKGCSVLAVCRAQLSKKRDI